jgi:hypothetical protein
VGQSMRGPMAAENDFGNSRTGLKQRATMANTGYHPHLHANMHDAAKTRYHGATHMACNMAVSQSTKKEDYPTARKVPRGQAASSDASSEGCVFDNGAEAFAIQVSRVETGDDARTTLMVKNIPNKYTQRNLLDLIDATFTGAYDFFYLPIDFKNKCNLGYAFINFRKSSSIVHFFREFDQKRWGRFNSDKICVVTYARIQGRQALVSHFRSSRLMLKHEKYRPLVFNENGRLESMPVAGAPANPSSSPFAGDTHAGISTYNSCNGCASMAKDACRFAFSCFTAPGRRKDLLRGHCICLNLRMCCVTLADSGSSPTEGKDQEGQEKEAEVTRA